MVDFRSGPIHNAMRRMTELIDLENLEGYFEEILLETKRDNEFDTLPEDETPPTCNDRRGSQSHVITIQSYTKICFDSTDDQPGRNSEKPASTSHVSNQQQCDKAAGRATGNSSVQSKVKKISTVSKVSNKSSLEKNAWKQDRNERPNIYNKEDKGCSPLVYKFLFGNNSEYKWYSLKGKGFCFILPMLFFYIFLCIALLPFIIVAAAVSAVVLGASVCSYFLLATKKVGVASDDENDKSCLEAVWWWA